MESWNQEHDFLLQIGLGLRPIVKRAARLAQLRNPFPDIQISCPMLLLRVSKPTQGQIRDYPFFPFDTRNLQIDQHREKFVLDTKEGIGDD